MLAETISFECQRDANGIGLASASGLGQRTVEPCPKAGRHRFARMVFSGTSARVAFFYDTSLSGPATVGEAL